jgi:hypothetical protein
MQSRREDRILTYCQSISRSANIPFTATLRCARPGSISSTLSGEIWRMTPADYAKQKSVVERQPKGCIIEPRIGQPVWSPDGRKIAFTLTPDAMDYTRYELWVFSPDDGKATRVSPTDGQGYFAPVWIDSRRLGALSPRGQGFDVVTISLSRNTRRRVGTIESADCDWSPDRSEIVYAMPKSDTPVNGDSPTTLHILETKLKVRGPWRFEALEQ